MKKNPNIKGSFSGPLSWPGAKYSFEGNKQVGKGSCEITESKASEYVNMRLLMTAPMKADNKVAFTLTPDGGGKRVT